MVPILIMRSRLLILASSYRARDRDHHLALSWCPALAMASPFGLGGFMSPPICWRLHQGQPRRAGEAAASGQGATTGASAEVQGRDGEAPDPPRRIEQMSGRPPRSVDDRSSGGRCLSAPPSSPTEALRSQPKPPDPGSFYTWSGQRPRHHLLEVLLSCVLTDRPRTASALQPDPPRRAVQELMGGLFARCPRS